MPQSKSNRTRFFASLFLAGAVGMASYSDALDGYQSKSRQRASLIAESCFNAIAGRSSIDKRRSVSLSGGAATGRLVRSTPIVPSWTAGGGESTCYQQSSANAAWGCGHHSGTKSSTAGATINYGRPLTY